MKRPKTVAAVLAALALACIGAGIGAVLVVQRSLAPARRAVVGVTAVCDSETAEDAERAVAVPLEAVLRAVPGVAHVRTRSTAHVVAATVEPDGDVDVAALRASIAAVLSGAALPAGAFAQLDADADPEPVRRLYFGGGLSREARSALAARLRTALLSVPGVAGVRVCGEDVPAVRVVVDPVHLLAEDVAFSDLRAALDRVPPHVAGIDAVASAPFATRFGHDVRISDLATVESGLHVGRCHAATQSDGEVVSVEVLAARGTDDRAGLGRLVDAAVSESEATSAAITTMPDELHLATGIALVPAGTSEEERLRIAARIAHDLAQTHEPVDVVVQTESPDAEVPVSAMRIVVGGRAQAPPRIFALSIPGVIVFADAPGRTLRVEGPDLDALHRVAERVQSEMNGGTVSAHVLDAGDTPWIHIVPDEAEIARRQIDPAELDTVIALARTGVLTIGTRAVAGEEMQLDLTLGSAWSRPPERAGILVHGAGGARMPLHALARIEQRAVPEQIVRYDGRRVVEVRAYGPRRDVDEAVHALNRTVPFPPGVVLTESP